MSNIDLNDIPPPFGALSPDEFQEFNITGSVSQAGTVATAPAGMVSLMQVGDEIHYPSASAVGVIYAKVDSTHVKVHPPATISAQTDTFIRRNLTVYIPPRALLPEQPVWIHRKAGWYAPLETATRLVVRVTDETVSNFVSSDDDQTVLAFVSDYAAIDTTQVGGTAAATLGHLGCAAQGVTIL